MKKTRQNKKPEPGSDSIRTKQALIIAHAYERNIQLQARRLLCEARAGGGHIAIGTPRNGYIDLIHPEHAGRTGRKSLGEQGSFKALAFLLPTSRVRERRIAPTQPAIRAKLHDPSAFTDRRSEPDRIFALSNQLSSSIAFSSHRAVVDGLDFRA